MIYTKIEEKRKENGKMLAVLVDPDKTDISAIRILTGKMKNSPPDFIFVGGSLIHESIGLVIEQLKQEMNVPVVLFPGNACQFSEKADALLFLSLISGRNPEYLIGQHVLSACEIKKSRVEVISTGYILIDGGRPTSVQYVSNTMPIPHDKPDIAVATAIAGELIGNRVIYLEGGSGALYPVSEEMISSVRKSIGIPLIVGGGLRSADDMERAYRAGADLVVIGNILESRPEIYDELLAVRDSF
ncbi:MAG: geranylgeranylglyceryl/heptaprenylglyceryl phosphate synthase [Paludibacteraceae bacterium]